MKLETDGNSEKNTALEPKMHKPPKACHHKEIATPLVQEPAKQVLKREAINNSPSESYSGHRSSPHISAVQWGAFHIGGDGWAEAVRSPSPMNNAATRHSPITAVAAPALLLSADVCLAVATPRDHTAAAAAKFGANVHRRAGDGDRERAAMEVELRLIDKSPELRPTAAATADGGSGTLWEEMDAERRSGGNSDESECMTEVGAGLCEKNFLVDLASADTEVCSMRSSPLERRRTVSPQIGASEP